MSESDDLLDPGVSQTNNPGYGGPQKVIPNANAVLVLGIISIVGCIAFGIVGLVCGIIALVLNKKVREVYLTDPVKYENSFKNAKAGMICAIIGICISAIGFLYWLFYFVMVGTLISSMPVR